VLPPDANLMLPSYLQDTVVPINGELDIACQTGFFFKQDFAKTLEKITCLAKDTWSTIEDECVERELNSIICHLLFAANFHYM